MILAAGAHACGPSIGGDDGSGGDETSAETASESGAGGSGGDPTAPGEGGADGPAMTTAMTTSPTAGSAGDTGDTGDDPPDLPKLDLPPPPPPVQPYECCNGAACEGGTCINDMCIAHCNDDPGECPPPPDGSQAVVGCVMGGGDLPGPFESSYCAFACGFSGCPAGFACADGDATCTPIACQSR
jgi:hypothetical protein